MSNDRFDVVLGSESAIWIKFSNDEDELVVYLSSQTYASQKEKQHFSLAILESKNDGRLGKELLSFCQAHTNSDSTEIKISDKLNQDEEGEAIDLIASPVDGEARIELKAGGLTATINGTSEGLIIDIFEGDKLQTELSLSYGDIQESTMKP